MALHGLRPDDPSKLGPYELRGRLGAGGMGVVYLGFGADGEAVAVKTLPGSASADSRERMRREARVLASVDFPGVARLVTADPDAGNPWLALAYISGPSLLEATKPLRDAPLRQFAHGLAEALTALHAVGVTHRDVKPANVILTFDGPVLVDLGIARTEDMATMTQAGTVIGSAGWMSPEQLRGRAEGPPSDVWGWGAVLVYAATGRPPFGEGALEALAWRIQSLEPDLDGVPDWLLPAVKGALTKDSASRPAARDLFPDTASATRPPPAPAAPAAT
ncbi:MAG: serine/threonine protein kinase, partial [Actinomycetota bacterium]|nr:serine/threonine protein kinase [Actinomycetota bacterium]